MFELHIKIWKREGINRKSASINVENLRNQVYRKYGNFAREEIRELDTVQFTIVAGILQNILFVSEIRDCIL